MTTWFTSDEHYHHKNILKFSKRPFSNLQDMHQALIDNNNRVVEDKDVVYHLGDFSFANPKKTQRIIDQLKGKHVFINGSHDYWARKMNLPYIIEKKIDGNYIVMCHYAMRTWARSHYNSWNLHGHSHGTLDSDGKQMDVGVDCNEFFPVSFDMVAQIMNNLPDNFNFVQDKKGPTWK